MNCMISSGECSWPCRGGLGVGSMGAVTGAVQGFESPSLCIVERYAQLWSRDKWRERKSESERKVQMRERIRKVEKGREKKGRKRE